MGNVGGAASYRLGTLPWQRHMKSVYSTLFLGLLKLRNFQITVKNAANGRCLCGYVYSVRIRRESVGCGRIAYFRVRLCAFARSTVMGNAKASTSVNEQTVRLSRFCFYKPIIRQRSEPGGIYYDMQNDIIDNTRRDLSSCSTSPKNGLQGIEIPLDIPDNGGSFVGEYLKKIYEILLSSNKKSSNHKFYFRGHENEDYKLIPSIGRDLSTPHQIKLAENDLLNNFRRMMPAYSAVSPKSKMDLMFIAQHYKLKTRLLDWSLNPLVALFFACDDPQEGKNGNSGDKNGRVLIKKDVSCTEPLLCSDTDFDKDFDDLMRETGTTYEEVRCDKHSHYEKSNIPNNKETMFLFPDNFDVRFQHQHGIFQFFRKPWEESSADYYITIPGNLKKNILEELAFIGFDRSYIYPTLDELAKVLNKNILSNSHKYK